MIRTWGPYPIQPAIVRASLDAEQKRDVAHRLLTLHERYDLRRHGFARFTTVDDAIYSV